MSDDDDKRIVDSVLALVGISDPLSADGRLSGETRNRLLRTIEWDAAADVLEADPILGPVLNKRIGTSFVLEAEVLYDLVIGGAQTADPGMGVRQVLASLRDRYRTTVPVVSIEPITGIVVGTPIRVRSSRMTENDHRMRLLAKPFWQRCDYTRTTQTRSH